jgi:DNA repair exonuclease SbcCD ATPase subunit
VAERADNDRLWKEFTDARQPFFDAQHAHYNKVEADQKEAAQAKQALVDEARELCEGSDFSREATERAKDLDRRWRKIGYAGKELNDRLWEDFNKAKEGFWDKKRAYGEERHEEWRQRTEDAIERREKRIANLKQQTEHLRERIANAYATDHVEEMQERLDDKLDLIKQIEDEVKDIKSRLDD